jgi:hypothetical protein
MVRDIVATRPRTPRTAPPRPPSTVPGWVLGTTLGIAIVAFALAVAAMMREPKTVVRKEAPAPPAPNPDRQLEGIRAQIAAIGVELNETQQALEEIRGRLEAIPKPEPQPTVDPAKVDRIASDLQKVSLELEEVKSTLRALRSETERSPAPAPDHSGGGREGRPPQIPPGGQIPPDWIERFRKQMEDAGMPPDQIEEMLKRFRERHGGG